MLTPHRVAGGAGPSVKLEKVRITIGTFVASGEQFKIEDQYTEPRAAHLMLEHAWVGTSEFREITYEGNNKSSDKWADWAVDEEFGGFDAAASINQIVGVSEKGRPDTKVSTRRPLWSLTVRFLCDELLLLVGGVPLFTCAVQRVDRGGSQIKVVRSSKRVARIGIR